MIDDYFKANKYMRHEYFPAWFANHLRDLGVDDAGYAQKLGIEQHIVTQVRIGYIEPTRKILDDLGLKVELIDEYEPKTIFEHIERTYYAKKEGA